MKLKKIDYTNYRGLGTGSISFEDDITVIIGKNGAGKTSVLTAVAIAISWIVARLKSDKNNGNYIDEESITNGQNHANIIAHFDKFEKIEIPNKSKPGITKKYTLNIDDLKDYVSSKRQSFEKTNFQTSIPVFAFYGVKRAVIDIPLKTRDKDFNLLTAYDDCLKGGANFRNFFIWFRNQEDFENELRNFDPSFKSKELETFRCALDKFMPEYRNIHVRRRPLRMVVEKAGKTLNVSQLSDGEKIYLALIGDLCQRLVLANPTLNDPLMGEGIVLIDEIDLHLHPEWQGLLAKSLSFVFPNIQFIVTTHSPHVINRLPSKSLRLINALEIDFAEYGYGLPSNIILKDLMGLEHDVPEEIEEATKKINNALDQNDMNSALELCRSLEILVPGYPDLVRIRKVIERMQRRAESI